MKLRTSLVALGAACALTLTACGSAEDAAGGDSDTSGSTVGDSASDGLTQDTFASSVSDAQTNAESTHMEMTVEAMGQTLDATGDIHVDPESNDPKDAEMAMTVTIPQLGDLDMRLVDGMAYISMGEMTQNKFVKMDLTDPDNAFGQSFGELTKQADPNSMVNELADSLKDFEKTDETEEMDGVEATKYILTIDGKALGDMVQSQSATMGGTSADMPDEVVVDAWVGEDDLLRKVDMNLDMGSTPADVEMTFSDWGEPVDVEAPPASEITDSSMFDSMTM